MATIDAMSNPPLDIEAIKARHAAATKGPYINRGVDESCTAMESAFSITSDVADEDVCFVFDDAPHSAEFIARSWQDVADLIAEVERLRAENAAFARLERWIACGWGRTAGPIRHVADYQIDLVGGDDDPNDCGGSGEGPTLAAAINAALDAAGAEK